MATIFHVDPLYLVDPSKTDLPELFHIMYMAQIPVISHIANQSLSHKMQQMESERS